MASRKALVVKTSGVGFEEKPATDTLDGVVAYNAAQTLTPAQAAQVRANIGAHSKFTGTTTTPFTIQLGATQQMTLNVQSATGDTLAAGEDITIQPTTALPGGINIAWYYVSAANTVIIGFTSSTLISLTQTMNWRVTAHR